VTEAPADEEATPETVEVDAAAAVEEESDPVEETPVEEAPAGKVHAEEAPAEEAPAEDDRKTNESSSVEEDGEAR
jgi:hypothetical protein